MRARQRHKIGAAGRQNGVDLVRRRDRAHAHGREPRLVPDLVGKRRLIHAAEDGLCLGDRLAGGDIDEVAAGLGERACDHDRIIAREPAVRPVRRRNAYRHRLLIRPCRAHGAEDFEWKTHAVFESAAILVRPPVCQRRNEAREQVTMGSMHLQHVESRTISAFGCGNEVRDHRIHVGARHFTRDGTVREIRKRRRRDDWPSPVLQRLVDSFPHELGRAFATGMAELHAEFGSRLGMHEIDDPFPRRLMGIAVHAGTTRRDPGVRGHVGHLREHEAGAAHGARAVMHEVPIVGQSILRGILAHRRNNDAILERHAAQAQRLKHRDDWAVGVEGEALRTRITRDHLVGPLDEFRRAQSKVVVGNGLGARHQPEGEAGRIHVPESVHMLEPDEGDVSGMLRFFDLLAPLCFEMSKCRARVFSAGRTECLEQCNAVFHRELGAGADRKMRGRLGVSDQDHVARNPALAANSRKIAPD